MENFDTMSSWLSWGIGGALAVFATAFAKTRQRGKRKLGHKHFFYRFVGGARPLRARRFVDIGGRTVVDVKEMLGEGTDNRLEARVLIPLVADLRRRGDRLVASRGRLSSFVFSKLEFQVSSLHEELIRLEHLLRQLPRSKLTLEDVLAGNFETPASEGT